ncbi:ATP-dependent zinc metalloprotease FtsH [Lentibacillus sp. JNUCC-1]|nr:ATP-dependent zinc metalloprotease FtsH [Lentibacillus sp. JNUCC-1]
MSRVIRHVVLYVFIFLVLIGILSLFKGQSDKAEEYNVQEFMDALSNGEIHEVTYQPVNGIVRYTGTLNDGKKPFVAQVPDNTDLNYDIIQQAQNQSVLKTKEQEQPSGFLTLLTTMIPFLIIGLIFFFILSQAQGGGGGGRMMNFGKSKAKLVSDENAKVKFGDVAGADEEKQELVEVVEFLKDPRKFSALGARIPKGSCLSVLREQVKRFSLVR